MVQFIDSSTGGRTVHYDTTAITIQQNVPTDIPYTIQGTALKGYVRVQTLSAADIERLAASQTRDSNQGYLVPQNDTEYVPAPDVPTIIDAPADSGSTEEYLALNLINGQTEISLKAFPEAQNARTLVDTLEKVSYQNPMILGLESYCYNYLTLTLQVKHNEAPDVIAAKQQKIVAETDTIFKATIKDGMSDEQKRKAIYDYLNDNTDYDDAVLENAEENQFKEVDEQ